MNARFQPGQRVQVRVDAGPPRHLRTPAYVQGRTGRIEAVHGAFRDPETLAYGEDGLPRRWLYLVSFAQDRLWTDYAGEPEDRLFTDLYEQWLEPAGHGEAA